MYREKTKMASAAAVNQQALYDKLKQGMPFAIKSMNGKYITVDDNGDVHVVKRSKDATSKITIEDRGNFDICLKSYQDKYFFTTQQGAVVSDRNRYEDPGTVFRIEFLGGNKIALKGRYFKYVTVGQQLGKLYATRSDRRNYETFYIEYEGETY